MSKWNKPVELSALDAAFGPKDISTVLPAWEEIPDDFKAYGGDGSGDGSGEAKKWVSIVDDIFFRGVELKVVVMKPEINKSIAMRHLQCVLHSFDPSHEHKTAGAAYLASLWFERFDYLAGVVK